MLLAWFGDLEGGRTKLFSMKRSTIKSRFLDWYLSVSLKNACEWLFKWYFLLSIILISVPVIFWNTENTSVIFDLAIILIGLIILPVTYIFNRILINRILQVQDKKSVLIYLLNATYIIRFFVDGVIEDIQYYMNFFYVVFLFVFNALIIRYGYPVYRKAFWFMLYAGVLRIFSESTLSLIASVCEIVFYVQLYLTAKRYNM